MCKERIKEGIHEEHIKKEVKTGRKKWVQAKDKLEEGRKGKLNGKQKKEIGERKR